MQTKLNSDAELRARTPPLSPRHGPGVLIEEVPTPAMVRSPGGPRAGSQLAASREDSTLPLARAFLSKPFDCFTLAAYFKLIN